MHECVRCGDGGEHEFGRNLHIGGVFHSRFFFGNAFPAKAKYLQTQKFGSGMSSCTKHIDRSVFKNTNSQQVFFFSTDRCNGIKNTNYQKYQLLQFLAFSDEPRKLVPGHRSLLLPRPTSEATARLLVGMPIKSSGGAGGAEFSKRFISFCLVFLFIFRKLYLIFAKFVYNFELRGPLATKKHLQKTFEIDHGRVAIIQVAVPRSTMGMKRQKQPRTAPPLGEALALSVFPKRRTYMNKTNDMTDNIKLYNAN